MSERCNAIVPPLEIISSVSLTLLVVASDIDWLYQTLIGWRDKGDPLQGHNHMGLFLPQFFFLLLKQNKGDESPNSLARRREMLISWLISPQHDLIIQ